MTTWNVSIADVIAELRQRVEWEIAQHGSTREHAMDHRYTVVPVRLLWWWADRLDEALAKRALTSPVLDDPPRHGYTDPDDE